MIKQALPRWQKMLPQLSSKAQRYIQTGNRPGLFGDLSNIFGARTSPRRPMLPKNMPPEGFGSEYHPVAQDLRVVRNQMRSGLDGPMANNSTTSTRLMQGNALLDPRVNFLSGLASSYPGMPRPTNVPGFLTDAVGWLTRKAAPNRWSSPTAVGGLLPHMPTDIAHALHQNVADSLASANPLKRLGGLVNQQVMKVIPGMGTRQRPFLAGTDPMVRRHELGHYQAMSQPTLKTRAQTANALAQMQQNDPTFLDRFLRLQQRAGPARASMLPDEVAAQYAATRSMNPRAQSVINASTANWNTPGVMAQKDPRLASVMSHMERNYGMPTTPPEPMTPLAKSHYGSWARMSGQVPPATTQGRGLMPSGTRLPTAWSDAFQNRPIPGLQSFPDQLRKFSSTERRQFFKSFLDTTTKAPIAYIQNSAENWQAVHDPTKQITRRAFLPNIPKAGVVGYELGAPGAASKMFRLAGFMMKHMPRI